MSGGAYDYFFGKLDDFIDELKTRNCPYRLAFKDLLKKVSEAMYTIEWVDSDDYSEGDEIDAIKKALGDNSCLKAKSAAYDKIKSIIDKGV